MSVEAREHDGARVLRATAELDAAVVPELLTQVPQLVAGTGGVVLDLSEVTFFDSSGVRLVDRLARECRHSDAGFLVVAPPGGSARRVLEIVGMATALVVDDLPTALGAVKHGA